MKRLFILALGVVLVVKYTERGKRAQKVYIEEVSSGSKPIEAVGTAIAAFVGLDESGGTSHTHHTHPS